MSLRSIYRRAVPERVRRTLRIALREVPIRVRDSAADLRDRFANMPLPPARLRSRVGTDSSRAHFLAVGAQAARDIVSIVQNAEGRWLDFGCGSGRVARHILALPGVTMSGVDVDAPAVRWCARHLPGDFRVIDNDPPLPFDAASFDVVCAVSVFTHFDEPTQFRWLAELRRVLRDGGVLVASTHPPDLTYNRPDLSRADHEQLNARGFAFIRGSGAFNDDSAFHSMAYLAREWPRAGFELVEHRPAGLNGYQDLSLWRAVARP
jgi:SAM-dependent methyltransferase